MRRLVLLVATVSILATFSGCLAGDDGGKKEKPPEMVLKQGNIQQISAWAESNWADSSNEPFIVDIDIPITLNHSNFVSVEFTILVEDSDSQHAESDQGSDPDEVVVTASGGNITTEEQRGTTPASIKIEARAQKTGDEMSYLSGNWNIHLHADCYGGKPMYLFGLIVYKDQGLVYTIAGQFSYMVEEVV
jgi:hypothetical protein